MSQKLTLWILGLLIIIIALSGRILRVEGAPMLDGAQTSVASTLQAIFTPQTTATVPPSLLPVTGWVIPTSLPTNTAVPTTPAVNLVAPSPIAALPYPPTLHEFKYYCDYFNNTLSFNLFWNDKADNESGYRIFRDGALVAELPVSSTIFTETIGMPASRNVTYYVQAYNSIGSADGSFVKLSCDG